MSILSFFRTRKARNIFFALTLWVRMFKASEIVDAEKIGIAPRVAVVKISTQEKGDIQSVWDHNTITHFIDIKRSLTILNKKIQQGTDPSKVEAELEIEVKKFLSNQYAGIQRDFNLRKRGEALKKCYTFLALIGELKKLGLKHLIVHEEDVKVKIATKGLELV